jgi:carboxypeptidase family protein
MTLKRIPTAAISSLLCSLLSIAIFAQTAGTSRVTGVIQDPNGSIVAGAKVTLTNEGTNISYTVATTSAGVYVFDGIQLGVYTVIVEKEGFKKFISKGNVLTLGQPLTVNASLTIGQAEEAVEVTASYERVQTSTSGNFGATVDNKTLVELPLGLDATSGGRNPLTFVRLQPGVSVGANTGGGSHVNGARDRAFNYTLDGIDINESSAGGSEFSPLRTNPDSLQEFRVITSNATAEYGRSSGAQVALVTKSGTNQLHGNLFYFHRNSALSANEWQNNLNNQAKPALRQHQFGGDVGGPVKIPGLYNGKDRTFFFFNYQGQRQIFPVNLTRTVYTESAKQGIFRYVVGGRNFPAGQTGASVDAAGNPLLPACGGTVTTNCIATYNVVANDPRKLGIDPTIQKNVLDLLPAPNNFTGGDGLNTANYIWTIGRLDPQRDITFKIDHKFNDSHTMFVRYAWGSQNTINDTTNAGAPAFPGLPPKVNTTRDPRNMAVSYRTVITPSLTNEFVVGGNHFTFNFVNPSVGQQPFSIITVNPTDPLDFSEGNLRTINTYQIVDNLSWVKGAHLVKGGVNFRYTQHRDVRGSIGSQNAQPIVKILDGTNSQAVNPACLPNNTAGLNGGQERFCLPALNASNAPGINANDRTRLTNTINDLLGRPFSVTQGFVADEGLVGFQPGGELFLNDARYGEYDFYIQDTWKLRPNLTLDLGVRNELRLTPFARGRLYGPQQLVTLGAPATNALRWVDRDIYESDLHNWSPSIGLAWDPWGDGKTAIRANYRLASDRINTFVLSNSIYNTIPGVTLGVVNTEFGQTGGPNGTGGRISDGIPSLAPPSTAIPSAQLQPAPFGNGTITVVDPDFQSPLTNQWSLNIQRDLGKNLLVDVSYIGRKASHLFGAYNIGQVDIFNNGFLNEYNKLVADPGYRSPLFDKLLGPHSDKPAGRSGSDFLRTQFATQIANNDVAGIANTLAGRIQGGRSLLDLAELGTTFFRPFPQFANINVIDSNDYSTYHALQVMVQRKFSKGLQFQGSYTFSKSLDTRSFDPAFTVAGTGNGQAASSTPFDNNRRFLNYARSDFDRTHVFIGYATWELPFGKDGWIGSGAPGGVQRFIEGWNVNGVLTMQTGRPFTIYSGANQLGNVINSTVNCNGCPRSMGDVDKDATNFGGVPGYFTADEIAKFSQPGPGEVGNTSRNYFTGPGAWNVDMAVLKRTKFSEKANFELRFEFFNVFNHPSFGIPNPTSNAPMVLTSTAFGRIRDTLASESRKIRIGAKINF